MKKKKVTKINPALIARPTITKYYGETNTKCIEFMLTSAVVGQGKFIQKFLVSEKDFEEIEKVYNSLKELKNTSSASGRHYDRKEIYTIEDVLSKVLFIPKEEGVKQKVDFDGDLINMASDRYKTFKTKGVACVEEGCNLIGSFFAKEKSSPRSTSYHFNLYALDENGNEVLMTKDHTLPKSKGGKDELDNYEPMCIRCNNKHGDKIKSKK